MTQQLKNYKKWFSNYVADFYNDDEFLNANIKLKEDHSLRVCDEMQYLTDQMALSPAISQTAQIISIFHDLGRFVQFKKYRTYNDPKSVNHCLLSLEVIHKTNVLNEIPSRQQDLILKAIEYHGLKQLPANLNGDCLLLSQLIRDADKLDIYHVIIEYYKQYAEDPDSFKIEIELPDTPNYTPEIIGAALNHRRISYSDLQNWNDMKILQLSWVYDVNFIPTLKRIRLRKYIEKITTFLPKTQDIKTVAKTVQNYTNERIKKNK